MVNKVNIYKTDMYELCEKKKAIHVKVLQQPIYVDQCIIIGIVYIQYPFAKICLANKGKFM